MRVYMISTEAEVVCACVFVFCVRVCCMRCGLRRWCFVGPGEGAREDGRRGTSSSSWSSSPGLPLPVHWAGWSERLAPPGPSQNVAENLKKRFLKV